MSLIVTSHGLLKAIFSVKSLFRRIDLRCDRLSKLHDNNDNNKNDNNNNNNNDNNNNRPCHCQCFVHIQKGEKNWKEKMDLSDLVEFGIFILIRRSSKECVWHGVTRLVLQSNLKIMRILKGHGKLYC